MKLEKNLSKAHIYIYRVRTEFFSNMISSINFLFCNFHPSSFKMFLKVVLDFPIFYRTCEGIFLNIIPEHHSLCPILLNIIWTHKCWKPMIFSDRDAFPSKYRTMERILDGNSEMGAHVWTEIGNLIYLRHSFKSTGVRNLKLFTSYMCNVFWGTI